MHNTTVNNNFLQLVQQNSGIIYKICQSYCSNPAYREDLAQEIIYQLWKSGGSYDSSYKFTTWMYRVALNIAITYYRRTNKKQATVPLDDSGIDVEDRREEGNISEENINLLQRYINELRELDRALMILYLDSKSYAEIADITGLTETNVATKISRIKEKLKQRFL